MKAPVDAFRHAPNVSEAAAERQLERGSGEEAQSAKLKVQEKL
jgi:hypothetical protein